MKLNDLLDSIQVRSKSGDLDTEVTGVHYDSRQVQEGSMFVAIRGEEADGNDFIEDAIRQGAATIVSERSQAVSRNWVQVKSDREALAVLAGNYYRHPTREMTLVGITGTNGKTTTAHLVESILGSAGFPVALLGTIDHRGPGFGHSAERTTPEAPDLERMFRDSLDAGCRHGVMEVSSHAIELRRVEQLDFDVVAFTNLSGEHLDFHGGMDEYFRAKKRLFQGLTGTPPPIAVINRDDPHFEDLQACGNATVITFGLTPEADVYPLRFRFEWHGTEAEYQTPIGRIALRSSLLGQPNLYNLGTALAIAVAMKVPVSAVVQGVGALDGVPGRFELIDRGQPFRLIVDYAHTDDALDNLLRAAREITRRNLIVVFGAGGDRDPSKRQRMGEVAALHSDFSFVTSDNPRHEDPVRIIEMIESGLKHAEGRYACVPDRREAIRAAIGTAREDDTVIIAGKGHETYQVVGDVRLPFDDRAVARELLDEIEAPGDS